MRIAYFFWLGVGFLCKFAIAYCVASLPIYTKKATHLRRSHQSNKFRDFIVLTEIWYFVVEVFYLSWNSFNKPTKMGELGTRSMTQRTNIHLRINQSLYDSNCVLNGKYCLNFHSNWMAWHGMAWYGCVMQIVSDFVHRKMHCGFKE